MTRTHLAIAIALCLVLGLKPVAGAHPPQKRSVRFNRDIRPILSDKCFQCHGPDAGHRQAELRLDDEQNAKADREGYSVIVPEEPDASMLVQRILADREAGRMPPPDSGKELSNEEKELLRRWVAEGAVYEPHWSFLPPQRPLVPAVEDDARVHNDIDRFILTRLAEAGVEPSGEAERVTLIRRLYFDLIGLPPTPDEVDAFLADSSEGAYEQLVDRLLDSPHFGERMAIYWLDLVRYADTVGYHGDQEHPISPYRDYVINAFNENLPFDQFTIEQLAGDLLPDPTTDQLIATGYNRVLQTTHEGGAQDKEYRAKYAADRVRNASSVWMGATLGCAECHDHKFDPYTQRDFYSFAAFFSDIEEHGAFPGPDASPTKREPEMEVLSPLDRWRIEHLEREINDLRSQSAVSGDSDAAELSKRIAELEQQRDALRDSKRRTMVTIATAPRTTRVLARGDWMDESGPVVEPDVPGFLQPDLDVSDRRATRLDLARWLISEDHPQTSRVFVNRLWYLYFGVGLFKTLDDGGSQGEWPTHPELLDWLASEFVSSGWDVKHMVKLMVTSATYRQSSLVSDEQQRLDPENRLFARQSRFRLPAEVIRDNALAVSGLLVDEIGGASIRPYQPEGYYQHLNFPKRTYEHDTDADQYRRGVYMHWQRQFLHPMLKAFDAPSREECTAQRPISNTPLASLVLLNDPTFVEAARALAARVLREADGGVAERARWAWRSVLSREPDDQELSLLVKLYEENLAQYREDAAGARALTSIGLAERPEELDLPQLAAWTSVARAIMNLNETITRN